MPPASAPASPLVMDHRPLDRSRAAHLLRRVTFGPTPALLRTLTGLPPAEAVDRLMEEALARPLPRDPAWIQEREPGDDDSDEETIEAFFERNFDEWIPEVLATLLDEMTRGGLRARLVLFWHNHFVTGLEAYELAHFAHRYLQTLRTHALGHLPTFVHAMGRDPSMLIYLDGVVNRREAPNENYARELLELFTMGPHDADGRPNYTEYDIPELARALTGWDIDDDYEPFLDEDGFDPGPKTIFGQTGAFTYDDVVPLIFSARGPQVAHFIAEKLYRALVYDTPDAAVVQALAQILEAHDFEIRPALRALLTSVHFYEPRYHGAQIKSPMELLVGLARTFGVSFRPAYQFEVFEMAGEELEQEILNPPNVAGWPGHRQWLSASTLPARWAAANHLFWLMSADEDDEEPRDPVLSLKGLFARYGGADSHAILRFPVALARDLLAVSLADTSIDPITAGFAGDLRTHPLPDFITAAPAYEQNLTKRFLQGVPWYEVGPDAEALDGLIWEYLDYLVQRPEFQLT
ncbi:MAG: DUF1800 domain-containing protein [Bacteroidota bacterium]